MIKLDENNYRLFAAKNYNNTSCLGEDEFRRDLSIPTKIVSQIEKILVDSPKGNIRLLANLAVTFFNVFRPEAAKLLILYLTDTTYHPQIKTLLVLTNRALPEEYPQIGYCDVLMQKLQEEFD